MKKISIEFTAYMLLISKIILGLVTYMLLTSNVFACQTQTLVVGGKLQVCTICGSVVSCM
jgi:hypothetical protein